MLRSEIGTVCQRQSALQSMVAFSISPGSVIPSGCRPSRFASTMFGASSVNAAKWHCRTHLRRID